MPTSASTQGQIIEKTHKPLHRILTSDFNKVKRYDTKIKTKDRQTSAWSQTPGPASRSLLPLYSPCFILGNEPPRYVLGTSVSGKSLSHLRRDILCLFGHAAQSMTPNLSQASWNAAPVLSDSSAGLHSSLVSMFHLGLANRQCHSSRPPWR